MESFKYVNQRLLIIAKTYPELSSKYGETVCTAALTMEGQPRRLYPIPFRYLAGDQKFERYQWISAPIIKNQFDQRPESFNIKADAIELQEKILPTPDMWGKRAEHVLRNPHWAFDSVEDLYAEQLRTGQSIAVVSPRSVESVRIKERSDEDAISFEEKLTSLRAQNQIDRKQLTLFERSMPQQMKSLEFLDRRICVDWTCSGPECSGHSMQILDWEICELCRKSGANKAKEKVTQLLDLSQYGTKFFLGNFHMYPSSFAIIGLWYPRRSDRLF